MPNGRLWTIAALAAASMLLLAACGSSGKSNSSGAGNGGHPNKKVPVIGIDDFGSFTALDKQLAGIKEALKQGGYVDGKTAKIEVQNAQTNPSLATTIARKFVDEHVDLIITLATPSAEAAAQAAKGTNIPIVFDGINDPVGDGLVPALGAPPGGNITGVFALDPIPPLLEDGAKLLPNLHNFGAIFDPSQANSVTAVNTVKQFAKTKGWKVVEATVSSTNDVASTAQSLASRVDAIYMPNDNTVVSAFPALSKAASDAKIPLFLSDSESVSAGGFMALGHDDTDEGIQAGQIAVKVLNGTPPAAIAVQQVTSEKLYVNTKTAAQIGITIPSWLSAAATEVP